METVSAVASGTPTPLIPKGEFTAALSRLSTSGFSKEDEDEAMKMIIESRQEEKA